MNRWREPNRKGKYERQIEKGKESMRDKWKEKESMIDRWKKRKKI